MKRIYQIRSAIIVFLVILTLSVYALILGKTDSENRFNIITVPSDYALPERIIATPTESGLLISGEVHKNFNGSYSIDGHVDIEFISSDGSVLATGSTRDFRPGRMPFVSNFTIDVPMDRNEVNKIIVTHYAPVKEIK